MIENIRQQYRTNGIGRMAVILKETGEFTGWAGLKLERNVNGHEQFYDIGYRFIPGIGAKDMQLNLQRLLLIMVLM